MGVCYSYDDQWNEQHIKVNVRKKNKKKRRKKQVSVIIQQSSSYDKSFGEVLEDSFRDDLHEVVDNLTNSSMLQSSLAMGSIVEMNAEEQDLLFKNLQLLNLHQEIHNTQPIRLCNFKTKNFLHTHKIKLQKMPNCNEVSCCPYNSTHTLEYDIWEFKPTMDNKFYIYHPFTNRYLAHKGQKVFTSQQKKQWNIHSLGVRRNLGFIRIQSDNNWLCMTDNKALVKNHRQITLCKQIHISHLWEVIFYSSIT